MVCPKPLKVAHEEVQKNIFLMLPEKWERLYLYASVIDHFNRMQTGEMFFFYYPKGVLKKKPVNVYEVPMKFNIDEKEYFKLADNLYTSIKKLRQECIKNKEKPWTNITISIEKLTYKVEYRYDEITSSEEDINERHTIWAYKYLDSPYESYNREERAIIDRYLRLPEEETKTFDMPLYTRETGKKLEEITKLDKKMQFVTEQTMKEIEYGNTHIPKSQILDINK